MSYTLRGLFGPADTVGMVNVVMVCCLRSSCIQRERHRSEYITQCQWTSLHLAFRTSRCLGQTIINTVSATLSLHFTDLGLGPD